MKQKHSSFLFFVLVRKKTVFHNAKQKNYESKCAVGILCAERSY